MMCDRIQSKSSLYIYYSVLYTEIWMCRDLEDTFDEDLKDSACEMAKSIDHISEKASSQEHLRRRSVSAL